MDGCMEWMDGVEWMECMDGMEWMDGVGRWMDGWMGEWMSEWKEEPMVSVVSVLLRPNREPVVDGWVDWMNG